MSSSDLVRKSFGNSSSAFTSLSPPKCAKSSGVIKPVPCGFLKLERAEGFRPAIIEHIKEHTFLLPDCIFYQSMTRFYSIQCKHSYQLKSLLLAPKFKWYNDPLSWYAHDGSVICSLLVVAISSKKFAAIKEQISKLGEVYMPLTEIHHGDMRTLCYRCVMTLKIFKGRHLILTESVETKIADIYDAGKF